MSLTSRPFQARRPIAYLVALLAAVMLAASLVPVSASAATGGGLTWSAPTLIDGATPYASPPQDTGVACPTADLCALVDSNGDIVSSTRPFTTAPRWQVTHIPVASAPASGACGANGPPDFCFADIACPSATLCVAVGSYDPTAAGAGAAGPITGGIESSTTPTGGPRAWALTDTEPGAVIEDVACPSITLCVAVDSEGAALVSTDPAKPLSWTRERIDSGRSLQAITCPTIKLCVAVDNSGNAVASTKPAAGRKAWHAVATPGVSLSTVTCPTTKLCLAAGQAAGKLVSSTNPGAAKATWRLTQPTAGATAVYCEAKTLCFATTAGTSASIETSAAPTDSASWHATAANLGFIAMACVTNAHCLAVNGAASAPQVSNDPTGATASWAAVAIAGDGDNSLGGVSCRSASLCVTGDSNGRIISFSPKTGRPKQVTSATLSLGANIDGISCAGSVQCVAVADDIGGIGADGSSMTWVSANPSGGAASDWTRWRLPAGTLNFTELTGVRCATIDNCLLSDASGQVWQSLTPLKGKWTALSFDGPPQFSGGNTGNPLNGITCVVSICVAVGGQSGSEAGGVYSTDGKSWLSFSVDPKAPLNAVACPSVALCVAGDAAGDIVSTGAPLGGSWTLAAVDGTNAITSISCPRTTFCVAVDAAGNVLTTHAPGGPASGWTVTPVDAGGALTGVSCPSVNLCVAVDGSGAAVVGEP